jgi:hypothetical protein
LEPHCVASFPVAAGQVAVAPPSAILEAEDRPATGVILPNASRSVSVPTVLRRETRWLGDLPPAFRVVPGKPALAWHGRALYPEFVLLRLKDHWVEINRLLVPIGKHVCTGVRPRCSTCPVLEMCRQVGVTSHRKGRGAVNRVTWRRARGWIVGQLRY